MTSTPSPDLRPIPKVTYGGLYSLTSVILIALAQSAGINLSPAMGALIATAIYFLAAYFVPQKYQAYLEYINQVGELVAGQDPRLSPKAVTQKLTNPNTVAALIVSVDALGDLVRGTTETPITRFNRQ